MDSKSWYFSKTLWVNVAAIAAIAIQGQTGYVIDPTTQTVALGMVNLILRKISKTEITW